MTAPEPQALLDFHFESLQGMYFSEHHRDEFGDTLFSTRVTDPYYNFFSPSSPQTASAVPPQVKKNFRHHDRPLALYLTPSAGADASPPTNAGEPWATDAWLVREARSTRPPSSAVSVHTIGKEQRDLYVQLFSEAYSGDDPNDPYGQLDPSYATSLSESFQNEPEGYKKYYLIAYLDSQPAGIAVLFTKGAVAGVYGVGTVPDKRGNGVGLALMAEMDRIALTDNATHMMLQTEAGSDVQRWYERQGYELVFTASYFELKGD